MASVAVLAQGPHLHVCKGTSAVSYFPSKVACRTSMSLPKASPAAIPPLRWKSACLGGQGLLFQATTMQCAARKPELTRTAVRAMASDEGSSTEKKEKEPVPFGYTRKDVLLICFGVFMFGIGLKYGLEAFGVDPLVAGNAVQLIVVLGLCLGWVSTYFFRVFNKDMTYAKQLKAYEEAVMLKRLEEIPESELERFLADDSTPKKDNW